MSATPRVLVLNPIACDGEGLCHDVAPHLIGLDEWGFPLLTGGALRSSIAPTDVGAARDAVNACPALALHLERATP